MNDLDVKVAKALGWNTKPHVVLRDDGSSHYEVDYPAYSTDPAALPEMLAHLAVIAPDLELQAAWWSSASPTAWIAKLGDAQVEGATLFEAVARLCVACDEAK